MQTQIQNNLNTNTRPFEGEARYVTCHLALYVWNPFGAPTKNNTAVQMYDVGVRGFRIFLWKQVIVSKNYNFGALIKNNIAGQMFFNEFYSLTLSKKKSTGQIHWKEIWRSNNKQEKARKHSTLFIASTAFMFPLVRQKQKWAKIIKITKHCRK